MKEIQLPDPTTFFVLLSSFLFLIFSPSINAQVSMTTLGTSYTQNFDGVAAAAANGGTITFTGNTTIPGWYSNIGTLRTQLAGSARSNTGAFYAIVDGTDKSIGSRPSGGTNDIAFGVRMVNNTGAAITTVQITYTGEQWSIAENQNNVNTLDVAYQIGNNLTSSTAGSWTAIPALTFTQLYGSAQSASMGGTTCGGSSNQCLALNGNQSANRQRLTACLPITIPAGQEIFIRWVDDDNSANDHYFQIDDVTITPFNVTCSVVLPVTWTDITASVDENRNATIEWGVGSELRNDYFEVLMANEESPYFIPIGTVQSLGDTDQKRVYSFDLPLKQSGMYYFRIRQTDIDGRYSYSAISSLQIKEETLFVTQMIGASKITFSQQLEEGTIVSLYDLTGRLVDSQQLSERSSKVQFSTLSSLTGYIVVEQSNRTDSFLVRFE